MVFAAANQEQLAAKTIISILFLQTGSTLRQGVNVHGSTVPPGFSRLEGKASASCPPSHPYPYSNYAKCCSSQWKVAGGSDNPGCGNDGKLQVDDDCCALLMGASSVPCPSLGKDQSCVEPKDVEGGSKILVQYQVSTQKNDYRHVLIDMENKCSKMLDQQHPKHLTTGLWRTLTHNGKILACGGRGCGTSNCNGNGVTDCARLKPDLTWETIGSMSQKRHGLYDTVINSGLGDYERHWIGGGYRSEHGNPVQIEEFDGETFANTGVTPPIKVYYDACFIQVSGDTLLLAGGKTGGGATGQTNLNYFLYNMTSQTWSNGKKIRDDYFPNKASESGAKASCVRDNNGNIVMSSGKQEFETWPYDPKTDEWQTVGNGLPDGKCGGLYLFKSMGKIMGIGKCETGDPAKIYELVPTSNPAMNGGYWSVKNEMSDFGLDSTYYYRFSVAVDETEYPNLTC